MTPELPVFQAVPGFFMCRTEQRVPFSDRTPYRRGKAAGNAVKFDRIYKTSVPKR